MFSFTRENLTSSLDAEYAAGKKDAYEECATLAKERAERLRVNRPAQALHLLELAHEFRELARAASESEREKEPKS